jgi:PAS domain S-box-containing protein
MGRKEEATDAKLKRRFTESLSIKATKSAEADALFLSIGEGAIVTDSEANISRINTAAEDILGIKSADVIGKWYPSIVIIEDEDGNVIPNMERPMAQVFMTGKTVFRKVFARRSDGNRVALAMTVSPVLSHGKPVGAIEVFRDISEEVRLDQAKTEFIALASHQLRTPATAVKQYLNMLLEGYAGKLTDSQTAFIATANEGNERQLKIINDILKVAAADSGDMVLDRRKTELGKLIQSVVDEELPKLIKSRQKLIFKRPERPLNAEIDPHIFRMVLENLIDNAHKYTYPDKTIEVTLTPNGSTAIISIRDEGVGISSTDAKRLFQKFVRLESTLSVSAGGTGLGLYWVKKVLELHGANIAVESQVGKGTVFSITLPTSKTK